MTRRLREFAGLTVLIIACCAECGAQYKNRIYEPEFYIGTYYLLNPSLADSIGIDFAYYGSAPIKRVYGLDDTLTINLFNESYADSFRVIVTPEEYGTLTHSARTADNYVGTSTSVQNFSYAYVNTGMDPGGTLYKGMVSTRASYSEDIAVIAAGPRFISTESLVVPHDGDIAYLFPAGDSNARKFYVSLALRITNPADLASNQVNRLVLKQIPWA